MTIEPQNAVTVSTPVIRSAKQDEPNTLADYLANIARRFPDCITKSGAANPAALARRENMAMRAAGHQHGRTGTHAHAIANTPRVQALREAFDRRRADRDAAILEYLEAPRTSGDVATRFKFSKETAQEAMRAMKENGLVTMQRIGRTAIWQRVAMMEAAE